jgi:hypothetical protein
VKIIEPPAQIVYYLDNINMSIVEIENDVVGLKDILWVIYYKSRKTINFFKFRHSGSLRIQERNDKRGFFHGSKNSKQHYIEIDHFVVPFREKSPDQIPLNIRQHIHVYLNSCVL